MIVGIFFSLGMKQIVGIQGIKGSYHHQAAMEFFHSDVEVDECMTFDGLVRRLVDDKSDCIVMAIENSIVGSIIPNYALIDKYNLNIVGEKYINIHHHLLCLPGQKIEDINEVHSHPMALLQCKEFFYDYPHIRLVEDSDTAETARRIQQGQIRGIAAIASKVAAQMYGLDVLSSEIQTIETNMTRFVICSKDDRFKVSQDEVNKASFNFELSHKRGSLASFLNVMSDCRLNLTKIQSLPKADTPWKYSFFVAVTFENYDNYKKALAILSIMAESFKVLGEYKNGRV